MNNDQILNKRAVPKELESELNKKGICDYRIISTNKAKGRFNLWALENDGKELCIKWNCNENAYGKGTFKKEKEIYHWLEGETCIPKVVYNEDILATRYIKNGCTLRQWLNKNDDRESFCHLIRDIIQKYQKYLSKINEHTPVNIEKLQGKEQFNMFLNKLLYSGPYGTKVYKIENIRNKILKKLLKRQYAMDIKNGNSLIHGDFHLNNILIDNSHSYIIDLENIVYGNVNVELAYWYVQVWMLIYDKKELREILYKEVSVEMEEIIDIEEFSKVVKVYQNAILLNRRFHKNEKKVKIRDILARAAAPVEY